MTGDMETEAPPQDVLEKREAEASFFAREERILGDIAGGGVFKFRRGNQWAIDPETGEATYDPKFFEDKGHTIIPSASLVPQENVELAVHAVHRDLEVEFFVLIRRRRAPPRGSGRPV